MKSARTICSAVLLVAAVAPAAEKSATNAPPAIPWSQIGAKAGADYQGDGLAVIPDGNGARLHCIFQRLDGEATSEGLWLTSTLTNQITDRFQVKAARLGRTAAASPLADTGTVTVANQTARFTRAGLVEEYSLSMDGVRQDFVVTAKPAGGGQLHVGLEVAGAKVEATTYGAQLVLKNSGRRIAYNRLRATDANGIELPLRVEVTEVGSSRCDDRTAQRAVPTNSELAIVVDDTGAAYPLRIDPTFSDANWVSMGGLGGTDGNVYAAVMDDSGNIFIGGDFSVAGTSVAANVARWNGRSWAALGSGLNGTVHALAVSRGTLCAGGEFTTAGGNPATNIAQWNGTNWSAVGSGVRGPNSVGPYVWALAVSLDGTLYAGGFFTNAGGSTANYVAQWNGSSWSALGSGVSGGVTALAVSGGTLYAAGGFLFTGSNVVVNCIAQWNESSWSPLGSGLTGVGADVEALAVSGTNLYVGGHFTMAGGLAANHIAQWNGSNWSALGSGMDGSYPFVHALAVSGGILYAGGEFTNAGGTAASFIAQWNGTSWSTLGSGMNAIVSALAVSGTNLSVGGYFTTAGGTNANHIAQWNGSSWLALGSGITGPNGLVDALAVSGTSLFVGGQFTTAGGTSANNIAQWNGNSWSALSSGMDNYVNALAVSGTNLYAGGDFTTAGGTNASYIAQWNGNKWSPVGSAMMGAAYGSPIVYSLAVSGTSLYAGGWFTNAGGNAANNIAQWNGTNRCMSAALSRRLATKGPPMLRKLFWSCRNFNPRRSLTAKAASP